jgi:hypothetical protein
MLFFDYFNREGIMKSRKAISGGLLIVAFWCLGSIANAGRIESFSSNNASWIYGYGSDFMSPQNNATWVSMGGNPDGYITGPAANLYAVWTYTTGLYGDMTGLSLTIDTVVTGQVRGTAQFYLGRRGTYFIDDGTWAIGNDTVWTTHTLVLDSSNFSPWTGVNNNLYTLAQVLESPDDIGIFFGGGLASGTGNVDVDNYGTHSTIPESPTILLLGIGLGVMSLVLWRFRA